MAVNPFEHVLDSYQWEFFPTMGASISLYPLTKFMLLEVIAGLIILGIFIPLARRIRTGEPPRGVFWNLFESILVFIRDKVAKPAIGEHDADRYVPFLWTLFLFVLVCNLLGLFPFGGSPTASITVTLVLAGFAFLVIHGAPIARNGLGGYLKSYIPHGVPKPIVFLLLIPIEVMGNFIKAFVLAVRLFANMFAGHTVLAVILSFITMASVLTGTLALLFWPISIFSAVVVFLLSFLELFVAFLQAYIFVFLTAIFLGSTLHPEH
jgi:F-type H+-transporting ATPase subunit a